MKITDLPEEAQILCNNYKSSPATRAVLTMLTGKICPEVKFKKDIEEFLSACEHIVKKTAQGRPQANQNQTRTRRNNDEPTVTIKVNVSRLNYGTCPYTEVEYSNGDEYEVPVSIVNAGEDTIIRWLEENQDLFEDSSCDDMQCGDTSCDGYENEEVVIQNFERALSEAESILEEMNEDNQ